MDVIDFQTLFDYGLDLIGEIFLLILSFFFSFFDFYCFYSFPFLFFLFSSCCYMNAVIDTSQ